MTWYRDPRHPELGAMFCPDSEAELAMPPGMETCAAPAFTLEDVARIFGVPVDLVTSDHVRSAAGYIAQRVSDALDRTDFAVPGHIGRGAPPLATPRTEKRDWSRVEGLGVPESERESRLAEGRCYWCGVPLHADDPYEMFCAEDHQARWRLATQVDPEDALAVLTRTDYYGDDRPRPEPGDTRPSWLGNPIREPADTGTARALAPTPTSTWQPFGVTVRWDWTSAWSLIPSIPVCDYACVCIISCA